MNQKTLADLPVGAKGRIQSVVLPANAQQRLMEMGLTRNASVEVVRFAPMGDPIEIRVRGYLLSLRRNEALGVLMEESE